MFSHGCLNAAPRSLLLAYVWLDEISFYVIQGALQCCFPKCRLTSAYFYPRLRFCH